MFRVICSNGSGADCLESGRVLFRRKSNGVIENGKGVGLVFWRADSRRCSVLEFIDDEHYRIYPSKPILRWYDGGLLGRSGERIESDEFSGLITKERVLDQMMFRIDPIEWRYDESQRELYFDPPEPALELRVTAMAFEFFARCAHSD